MPMEPAFGTLHSETVYALQEALEMLARARRRVTIVMEGTEQGTAGYDALDRARRDVNHTEGLLRSILDKGR